MSDVLDARDSTLRKVLMIARSFPPFRTVGGSIRVVKFIKYLPKLGWLPAVLTIDDEKEYETTRKRGNEAMLSEIPGQVRIYRTDVGEPTLEYLEKESSFSRRNWLAAMIVKILGGGRRWALRNLFLPDRYLTWLPFALKRGRQIVKSEEIDVIYATCPPHSTALIGAFLKTQTGKPLVLDFRDDWIDTPWFHSRPGIIRLIERKLERWVVKIADKVVLVTEWSRNAFLERYPSEPKEKFILITNGCDLEEFVDKRHVTQRPLNSQFTIVHAGLLNDSGSWTRSPGTFFQALHNILKQRPELADDVTVTFTGHLPIGHRRLADKMGLSTVIKDLGHLPRDEFLQLLASADLLLVINYEGFSTLIPGKIYEYWAIGGPPILLLSCHGAAQELVKQKNLGITVAHDDVSAIEEAILRVYRRHEMGSPLQVSTLGIEEYDRKILTKKLVRTLSSLAPPTESES